MDRVVVHYHELALKKGNRPFFVGQLLRNILIAAKGTGVKRAVSKPGRILIELAKDAQWDPIKERLLRVPGIANFSPAYTLPTDIGIVQKTLGELIHGLSFESFAVRSRRVDKSFPLNSMQIDFEVGGYLKQLCGARVDLTNPELTVHIEWLQNEVICCLQKVQGIGGLPVGVSGRVVCLLSGGIDSPVAAYRMIKRGARGIFVHFHSHPFLSKASLEKAEDLASLLAQYQMGAKLYQVPFGELQREVVLNSPIALRVVLYRRFMLRIAEIIARRNRAKALVTGESLGQVSSQTLDNMAVIQEATSIPIFRPLIGMDKEEIINQAKSLGTFPVSILPDQDCCQLFIPKHPATRSFLDEVKNVESKLKVHDLVQMTMERVEVEKMNFP